MPYPRKKMLHYPLDRRLDGPRAGLDVMAKIKRPSFAGNLTPVVQPINSNFTG
jgi:hypothetical protein